jgi:hypothetical protein
MAVVMWHPASDSVIPAKAGISVVGGSVFAKNEDPRFRGNDAVYVACRPLPMSVVLSERGSA